MPEPEILKLRQIIDAARQRLAMAQNRDSWLKRQEQIAAADELLAEGERVLRRTA